jgi:hypothetical protein
VKHLDGRDELVHIDVEDPASHPPSMADLHGNRGRFCAGR